MWELPNSHAGKSPMRITLRTPGSGGSWRGQSRAGLLQYGVGCTRANRCAASDRSCAGSAHVEVGSPHNLRCERTSNRFTPLTAAVIRAFKGRETVHNSHFAVILVLAFATTSVASSYYGSFAIKAFIVVRTSASLDTKISWLAFGTRTTLTPDMRD